MLTVTVTLRLSNSTVKRPKFDDHVDDYDSTTNSHLWALDLDHSPDATPVAPGLASILPLSLPGLHLQTSPTAATIPSVGQLRSSSESAAAVATRG